MCMKTFNIMGNLQISLAFIAFMVWQNVVAQYGELAAKIPENNQHSYLQIPVNKSLTPSTIGASRFNSLLNCMEFYDGSRWKCVENFSKNFASIGSTISYTNSTNEIIKTVTLSEGKKVSFYAVSDGDSLQVAGMNIGINGSSIKTLMVAAKSSGEYLWHRSLTIYPSDISDIEVDYAGHILMATHLQTDFFFNNTLVLQVSGPQNVVLKITSGGHLINYVNVFSGYAVEGIDLSIRLDNSFLVHFQYSSPFIFAGTTIPSNSPANFFFSIYNAAMVLQQYQILEASNAGEVNTIITATDNGFYIGGSYSGQLKMGNAILLTNAGNYTAFLGKLESNLNFSWGKQAEHTTGTSSILGIEFSNNQLFALLSSPENFAFRDVANRTIESPFENPELFRLFRFTNDGFAEGYASFSGNLPMNGKLPRKESMIKKDIKGNLLVKSDANGWEATYNGLTIFIQNSEEQILRINPNLELMDYWFLNRTYRTSIGTGGDYDVLITTNFNGCSINGTPIPRNSSASIETNHILLK